MTTPNEIKKALECCSDEGCAGCPYKDMPDYDECTVMMAKYALAYIQQREAEKAELLEKIKQLEAERDALMNALRLTDAECTYCKHGEPYGEFCEICDQNDYSCSACQVADKCPCRTCTSQSKNWEWCGITQGGTNVLTMTEYQRLAARTSNTTGEDKICNGCLGLAGECGEVVDLYKKHRYQGHELDYSKMVEELGDVLWYVAEIASGLNISLGAIARRNIDKLRRRNPEGFAAERSINREGNT